MGISDLQSAFLGLTAFATVGLVVVAWIQLGRLRREAERNEKSRQEQITQLEAEAERAEAARREQLEKMQSQVEAMEKSRRSTLVPLLVLDHYPGNIHARWVGEGLMIPVRNVGPGPATRLSAQAWIFPGYGSPEPGQGVLTHLKKQLGVEEVPIPAVTHFEGETASAIPGGTGGNLPMQPTPQCPAIPDGGILAVKLKWLDWFGDEQTCPTTYWVQEPKPTPTPDGDDQPFGEERAHDFPPRHS